MKCNKSFNFMNIPQSFYNPMMHLTTMQNDQAEKQLIGMEPFI